MRHLQLIIFIFIVSTRLKAQECIDSDIAPTPGKYGYQLRSGDDRCEGLYTEKISGQTLDVISFTKGKFRFYAANDEELKVSAPSATSPIMVRGNNFGMNSSYRLSLKLNPNTVKKIPAAEVLYPSKITEKQLGIYGFMSTSNNAKTYIPVTVLSKKYKDRLEEETKCFLKLITNTSIEKAEWRYAFTEADKCGNYSTYVAVKGENFSPFKPIELEFSNEFAGKTVCIMVRIKMPSGDWNTKSFKLVIP